MITVVLIVPSAHRAALSRQQGKVLLTVGSPMLFCSERRKSCAKIDLHLHDLVDAAAVAEQVHHDDLHQFIDTGVMAAG